MGAEEPILVPWTPFYTITGSSAAALIGLMFVVITLVGGERRKNHTSRDGISIFSTPTVIHFGAAVFVSASLCAPWRSLTGPAIVLALAGIVGIVYVARATLKTRTITIYTPDIEDWVWYSIMPMVAYAAMLVAALTVVIERRPALFLAAASVALLIVIGIRNSWDVVTYITLDDADDDGDDTPPTG